MAKQPTKVQTKRKTASKGSTSPSRTAPKPKFDTTAFTFEVEIEKLEEAVNRCLLELEDLLEYQQPDQEQKRRIDQLLYWCGCWERDLPEAKRRGLKTVPLCAIENRVFGFYEGKAKRKKK